MPVAFDIVRAAGRTVWPRSLPYPVTCGPFLAGKAQLLLLYHPSVGLSPTCRRTTDCGIGLLRPHLSTRKTSGLGWVMEKMALRLREAILRSLLWSSNMWYISLLFMSIWNDSDIYSDRTCTNYRCLTFHYNMYIDTLHVMSPKE